MKYISRTLESVIKKAQKNFKVVMLPGMRQVGKSTMLEALSSDRGYVSLDRFQTLRLAKTDPESFFVRHPLPVTIDEIQRAPELMLEIKGLVDARKTYGDVWLTGSQRFSTMKNVAESLAGRVAAFEMLPMSLYERFGIAQEQIPYVPCNEPRVNRLRKKNADATWKLIFQGAWPKLMALDENEREWYFEGFLLL